MKQTVKTDYTYCVNEKCKNKCGVKIDFGHESVEML